MMILANGQRKALSSLSSLFFCRILRPRRRNPRRSPHSIARSRGTQNRKGSFFFFLSFFSLFPRANRKPQSRGWLAHARFVIRCAKEDSAASCVFCATFNASSNCERSSERTSERGIVLMCAKWGPPSSSSSFREEKGRMMMMMGGITTATVMFDSKKGGRLLAVPKLDQVNCPVCEKLVKSRRGLVRE